mmetsp:Transcript_11254/g.30906  ORF Transcript_11254/g.30906 Transcript_11254/m.30906 type:complete len:83 (-) Transcript_11254:79-327(-)
MLLTIHPNLLLVDQTQLVSTLLDKCEAWLMDCVDSSLRSIIIILLLKKKFLQAFAFSSSRDGEIIMSSRSDLVCSFDLLLDP